MMNNPMKFVLPFITVILLSMNVMAQNKYPMKVAMVSLFVDDPAKAFNHYTEVLGFEKSCLLQKVILPS